jgi:hypothetical protein
MAIFKKVLMLTILALALSFKGCHSHVHDDHNHDHEAHHHNHVERRFLKQNAAKPSKVKVNAPTSTSVKFKCETKELSQKDKAQFMKDLKALGDINTQFTINVSIYWHILINPVDNKEGILYVHELEDQTLYLNKIFNPLGFYFNYGGGYYVSDTYFNKDNGHDSTGFLDWRRKRHQGKKTDVNIYTANLNGGYALLPLYVKDDPLADGMVIDYKSVKSYTNYRNLAVHEMGHWLGLFHTFEGGCNSDPINGGDMIADTPAESGAHYDCDYNRDSCPSLPGKDVSTLCTNILPMSCFM